MCVFDESGQKSSRIVKFPNCTVLLTILGIVEVKGFHAPRFLGLLLPFPKAFCRFSRDWPSLRLRNVKRPLCLEGKLFCI